MASWCSDRKILPGGDIGGDDQAGDSYSLRYHLQDDPRRIVTVYTYPVEDRGRYRVETQTELMVCDDPRDPGTTEQWSDAIYATARPVFSSVAEAGRHAEQLIRDHRASDIRWDGKAP